MLEIQKIRENKDFIINKFNDVRKIDLKITIDEIYKLDEQKRETQLKLDSSQADLNLISSKIGELFKTGKIEQAIGAKSTEEFAVMIDTFKPLNLTEYAENIEDKEYVFSWRNKNDL